MPRPNTKPRTADPMTWWIPDNAGQSLEGYLEGQVQDETGKHYLIRKDTGEINRLPSHIELVRRLEPLGIMHPGCWVNVTFTGLAADQRTRCYKVEFWT